MSVPSTDAAVKSSYIVDDGSSGGVILELHARPCAGYFKSIILSFK